MKTDFEISSVNIPYGVLHDQKLKSMKYIDDEIMFTFDIELYPHDYPDDTYDKYKNYKYCDMKVQLSSKEDNYCCLSSCLDKNDEYKGLEITIEELCDLSKNANYLLFNTCLSNGNEFRILFSFGFYDAKGKYKKYKDYASLEMILLVKNASWNWY